MRESSGELPLGNLGSTKLNQLSAYVWEMPLLMSPNSLSKQEMDSQASPSPHCWGLGVGPRRRRLGGSLGSKRQAAAAEAPGPVGGECGAGSGVGGASSGLPAAWALSQRFLCPFLSVGQSPHVLSFFSK